MKNGLIGRLAIIGALTIGLGACATGGRYNSDYDRYYGDARGYSSVPYGYVGSNFGWSSGYYYPGTGVMVYNRSGQARAWSQGERRYWERRAFRQQRRQMHR